MYHIGVLSFVRAMTLQIVAIEVKRLDFLHVGRVD